MAEDLGPMAWSFLPENVQVQYLQKIALRAENPSGPQTFYRATDLTDLSDFLLDWTNNNLVNLLNP